MELMKHQIAAINRYRDKCIIPLFFGVGSGKTLTAFAIAVEKYRRFKADQLKGVDSGMGIDALLVIAPNLVDRQWASQEIPKYVNELFGDIDCYVYCNKKDKNPIRYVEGRFNIVCVNIDQFSQPTAYLRYVEWANAHRTMIVVDEATRIKNPKAKRTQRVLYEFCNVVRKGRAIAKVEPLSVARCILTGTPVTRGPSDLWAMFEFLQHDYFGRNEYSFKARYTMLSSIDVNGRVVSVPLSEDVWKQIKALGNDNNAFSRAQMLFGVSLDTFTTICQQQEYAGSYKHTDELLEYIAKDSMTIRTEDVVELPPRSYDTKVLEMSDEQKRVYKQVTDNMLATYKGKEVSAQTKLCLLIRQNQITSGFISSIDPSVDEDPVTEITWFDKVPKLEQLVTDMDELHGESVIICCRFTAEAYMVYEKLVKAGHSCCLITGQRREGSVEGFQNGEFDVMVANITVIATGLNLQNCHRMMFYNNTFSLEDRLQVEGRINRKGQTDKCLYTDYIMSGTVDVKIVASLRLKRQLATYIKDKSAEATLREVPNEQGIITLLAKQKYDPNVEWRDEDVLF